MTTAQDGLPQEGDAPIQGCNPACLCCRGGKATVWRTNANGWEPQACGLCGGYPEREPIHRVLLGDRLADLKACCKAYKQQLHLDDPLRTLTLKRAQGILQDMLDLEAGRGTRGAYTPSAQLDANAVSSDEEPQRGQ